MVSRAEVAPPAVLRPPLVAVDRMRTAVGLIVLVLALLIPGLVTTYAYTTEVNAKIASSVRERGGTDVVRPALLALADTAAGRDPDLAAVRQAAARAPQLELDDLVRTLPATGDATPAGRVALATALAGVITGVGHNANLVVDPDLVSFDLIDAQLVQMPKALVLATRAAAPGGAIPVAVLAGGLAGTADSLRTDLSRARAHSAAGGLSSRLTAATRAADAIAGMARALTTALDRPGPVDPAPAATAVRDAVPVLVDALNRLLDRRIDGFRRNRLAVLCTAGGGWALAHWFALALIWRTRRDLSLTRAGMTAIAAGDFTARTLPAGRGELGDIGRALDTARVRLIDQEVGLRADQASREDELRATFLQQRQAETRLRNRAQAIIDESTAAIAEELRLVTKQVGDVRRAADTIDSEIAATDAATSAVVHHAHRAEEVIASLERSLQRVASTAELVQGIARQTRLLALNATIEAVRAGELGLGFTVVADEVKELATTTSRSTEQIAATIEELERDTAEMSGTIAEMVAGIGSVGDAATSLRAVATDQSTVVGRLADRMGETIDRVERMSGEAAQLERRQSDRLPASGTVPVRRFGSGAATPATLLNVSSGGMRIRADPSLRLTLGDIVETELGAGAGPIRLRARIANRDADDVGDLVGLTFIIPDDATEDRIDRYLAEVAARSSR